MQRIYISSYYQLNFYQCDNFNATAQQVINQVVERDGTLLISRNNLKLVNCEINKPHYSTSQSDYLTALFCDIEVAIQEKKLLNISEKLGFTCTLEPVCRRPKLRYIEEYSVSALELSSEDKIAGNVYVINTHGKPGEIDGPYHQALDRDKEIQRIVIDACSSALPFIKKNGKQSVLEQVSDEALQRNLPEKLEFIGYPYDFSTDDSNLDFFYIFAKKESIQENLNACAILFTLEEKKLRLENEANKKKLQNHDVILNSLNFFNEKILGNSSTEDRVTKQLQEAIIEVASKIAAKVITKNGIIHSENAAVISLLMELTSSKEAVSRKLDTVKSEFNIKKSTLVIKQLREELKEQRKEYIKQISDPCVLYSLAERALDIAHQIGNTNLNPSAATLQITLDTLKSHLNDPKVSPTSNRPS